jgi:cellulose synthase/poly-beta-1,6-N-acetylglucosamine synthase-like glycosyltransferase
MTESELDEKRNGVSIITCTNKLCFMENIIENYINQVFDRKELIIILNNNQLKIDDWKKKAKPFKNVKIFQLSEDVSLGDCLNYGVSKAKYGYIAKFDDDDYYARGYLTEAMNCFKDHNVHIVGKRTYYLYYEKKNELVLRFPNRENRKIKIVHGGTIVVKKKVFDKVPFPDLSLGEDKRFLRKCVAKGFRIFSTSRFNYTYIRRDERFHTWNPNLGYLSRTSKEITTTTDYKKYADPSGEL